MYKKTRYYSGAIGVMLALTLAACTSTQTEPERPTVTVTASSSPSASPSIMPTASATPSVLPSASPTVTTRLTACHADQLTATVGKTNGETEHTDFEMAIRNRGNTPCYVSGYPRVQVVSGGNGTALGADAERSYFGYKGEGDKKLNASYLPRITLQPGSSKAYLTIGMDSVYAYIKSGGNIKNPYEASYTKVCGSAVRADGYRIYPNGFDNSFFVPINGGFPVCETGKHDLIATEFYPVTYN